MVTFSESSPPATDEEISAVETRIGLRFPKALVWVFRNANGGQPAPYVWRSPVVSTAVNENLALVSDGASAEWFYRKICGEPGFLPTLFPFANDPGGNLFCADCASAHAEVFFWQHDAGLKDRLVPLGVGLEQFWERLEDE